jgi:hypothetical protein
LNRQQVPDGALSMVGLRGQLSLSIISLRAGHLFVLHPPHPRPSTPARGSVLHWQWLRTSPAYALAPIQDGMMGVLDVSASMAATCTHMQVKKESAWL